MPVTKILSLRHVITTCPERLLSILFSRWYGQPFQKAVR
jgi:hypothetical protein